MQHRCDSLIINYLTLMTFDTPEMAGTKSKFRLAFRFRLDSVPATGRNFSGILNLGVMAAIAPFAEGIIPIIQVMVAC
jgi:hypothetical protein